MARMKLICKSTYLTVLLSATSILSASAQYDQDFNVEGKYTPQFIPQERISVFPVPVKFAVEKSTLQYSLTGVNANFTPQAIPIVATGWRDTRRIDDSRGYVDLGLGSWLDGTLSAGYRFVDSEKSTLGVRLQHNSTSLWKPKLGNRVMDVKRFGYDESIGLYGNHVFDGKGRLDAAIGYHLGYFNYYGYNPEVPIGINYDRRADAPTQTLNDVAARVGWTSPAAIDDISWHAGAGVRYFGYRRFYIPGEGADPEAVRGPRETDLSLDAGVSFPTSSKSSLGIDMDAHLFTYGGYGDVSLKAPSTYGAISLTPYYGFNRAGVNIRIGARIDLAMNAGDPGDRYRTFNIAPSVRVDYSTGPVALFVDLGGGNDLHSLACDRGNDYYQVPLILSTKPSYSPLDARLGITFGPFSGFHAGFEFAYRITNDQDYFGWYNVMLSGRNGDDIGLPQSLDGRAVKFFPSYEMGHDISGYSLGLNVGYDAGRYFKFDFKGTYQPQGVSHAYFNGMDRARWTADAKIETNPWSTLKFMLGCDFRGVRRFPVEGTYYWNGNVEDTFTYLYRVSDWLSLNFGASYGITDDLNVWIQADNLTGRHNILAPGLPTPGVTLAAGLGFRF